MSLSRISRAPAKCARSRSDGDETAKWSSRGMAPSGRKLARWKATGEPTAASVTERAGHDQVFEHQSRRRAAAAAAEGSSGSGPAARPRRLPGSGGGRCRPGGRADRSASGLSAASLAPVGSCQTRSSAAADERSRSLRALPVAHRSAGERQTGGNRTEWRRQPGIEGAGRRRRVVERLRRAARQQAERQADRDPACEEARAAPRRAGREARRQEGDQPLSGSSGHLQDRSAVRAPGRSAIPASAGQRCRAGASP